MTKKQELTYATAVAEIEEIMAQIESNELDIDKLTESVKRVATLIKFCKTKLYETEEEVNRVLKEIS